MIKKQNRARKKAVSSVITAVLLIGIVIVAVILVYNVVNLVSKQQIGQVESGFDRILKMFSLGPGESESPSSPAAEPVANTAAENPQESNVSATGNAISGLGESCYVMLDIQENEIDGGTEFNLTNVENVYGDYSWLVSGYDSGYPVTLRVYDSADSEIARYSYNTSSDLTDMEYLDYIDYGVLYAIIPYDSAMAKITIGENGQETDLNINSSELKCEKNCKVENEVGQYFQDECCFGYTPAEIDNQSFACTICGDNVCSGYETWQSCYSDCSEQLSCGIGEIKTEFGCIQNITDENLTKENLTTETIVEYKEFKDLYYETCSDSSCTDPRVVFPLNSNSRAWIKVFNSEYSEITGNLTFPNGSVRFINCRQSDNFIWNWFNLILGKPLCNSISFSLTQKGTYSMEMKASKEGYLDYLTYIEIYASADAPPLPTCNNNGKCESGERYSNCPKDCPEELPPFVQCGNGRCESGETSLSCPTDCKCGNGKCESGETSSNCPSDCYCGNGIKESNENCGNCLLDSPCSSTTVCQNNVCAGFCGNGVCESGESFSNCPKDCSYCSVEAYGFGEYGCEGYGSDGYGYGCGYGYGYTNEGKPCTTNSGISGTCISGSCAQCTQDYDCNDWNDCTIDYCYDYSCQYSNSSDSSSCDNGYGTCQSGACNSLSAAQCTTDSDCNDWNDCTTDYCDGTSCQYNNNNNNNGYGCDNGYGTCSDGICNPAECTQNSDCNDWNDCTTDYCDSSGYGYSCIFDYSINEGSSCDDGNGGYGTCSYGGCSNYGYGY